MIKGVIFDMDGVLVDNRDVHVEAFRIFALRHGFELPIDILIDHFGQSNAEIMPAIWPTSLEGVDLQALGEEKEEIYREIFREHITPTAGLLDFLTELKKRGYRMAVGSSGPSSNVNFVLDRCGIAGFFDAVVSGDMVTRCKPDPEIYLMAAKLLGLSPAQCLVVEDAPPGIEAAHRAGASVAVLATTFPRERFENIAYNLISDNFTDFETEAIGRL